MERALKKWMYAVRKENTFKKEQFGKEKVDTIDQAFEKMGVCLTVSTEEKSKVKL